MKLNKKLNLNIELKLNKKMKVILIEYLVCSVLALSFLLRPSYGPSDSYWIWLVSHIGPFLWIFYGAIYSWLWWVYVITNIICISSYLIYPTKVTGVISFLGIAGWFFSGIIAFEMGV